MTLSSNDYAEFWESLPGHLIDNHEGEELTEELLQRAAADLYAKFTDLTASGRKPFGLLLLEERATTRQLTRALREATEPPTFMGEPVLAAKPETQGELAELSEDLKDLATSLEDQGVVYKGDFLRRAAALLAAPVHVEPLTEEERRERFNIWYAAQSMPQLLAKIDPQQAAHNAMEFGYSLALGIRKEQAS